MGSPLDLVVLIWLIPLPPFIAIVLILLFTHSWRRLSHILAIGMMIISFGGT